MPRVHRICRAIFVAAGVVALAGAGYSGFAFADSPKDQVLLQMVFYGAWASLVGAWIGGHMGAMMEEDACGSMDMGVLSCVGAFFGGLAGGAVGTAAPGLAMEHGWVSLWVATVVLGAIHAFFVFVLPLELRRRPHVNERGFLIGPGGALLPEEEQPLRMKERVAVLVGLSFLFVLSLTLIMAVMMRWNFGHPTMLAPMMYGMSGTMAGGMLGGWLVGVLDEHRGSPEHDNPIMVAAMALMAGMMGGMPGGMIGGMMAVMGDRAIVLTVACAVVFAVAAGATMMRGRYTFARRGHQEGAAGVVASGSCDTAAGCAVAPAIAQEPDVANETAPHKGGASIRVQGMRCDDCVSKILREVGPIDGVTCVEMDADSGLLTVRWGAGFRGLHVVRERVRSLGYTVVS